MSLIINLCHGHVTLLARVNESLRLVVTHPALKLLVTSIRYGQADWLINCVTASDRLSARTGRHITNCVAGDKYHLYSASIGKQRNH